MIRATLYRENAPVFGVLAVLIMAITVLALFGPGPAARRPAIAISARGTADTSSENPPPVPLIAAPDDEAASQSILAPDDARSRNAAVSFVTDDPTPAPPFKFAGSDIDRARATDCLALAGMAEAGGGDVEQRAVMQVILNRVRHPAFVGTVCGAVFQGSQRRTGCQFTFTCDGSMARAYSDDRWARARSRAAEALNGYVYKPVGTATHYHTDWVYPYWSPSLDKIAKVDTHIFFRWPGYWGTPKAQSVRYRGGEPAIAAMAARNPLFVDADEAAGLSSGGSVAEADANAAKSPAPGIAFLTIARTETPLAIIKRARAMCPASGFCQVYGWTEATAVPTALPLPPASRRALRFSFVPARSGGGDIVFYDCKTFPTVPKNQCLPPPIK